MQRKLIASLTFLATAATASAEFTPTVLDRFDGSVNHTMTKAGAYSGGADNVGGALWSGFGATTGNKAFHGNFDATSTGYDAATVFATMAQSGGMLSLGLVVPTGSVLGGGGTSPSSARVVYSGAFDFSDKGGFFFFNFAAATAADAPLVIGVTSGGIEYTAVVATVSNGPRYLELAFSALVSSAGAAFAGDGSAVTSVFLSLSATADLGSSRNAALSDFGVVPTPATAALLGAALLAPMRRRRSR
jgi:hypothetical protein